jgi:heme exporter protein A
MRLEAHDLTCVRGGRTVFEGLTLHAEAGKGVSLTGPNGAGKSSLLRMLAGYISPAAGKIALEGGAPDTPVGEQCHFVGHLNGVKKALTVAENLHFWAGYLGGGGVDRALGTFALDALARFPAGLLSAGQARRLGLARLALVHRPVWLLDEPSVSLDAASRNILAGLIRDHLKDGGIVVAATHAPLGVKFARELKLGRKGKQ